MKLVSNQLEFLTDVGLDAACHRLLLLLELLLHSVVAFLQPLLLFTNKFKVGREVQSKTCVTC